MTDRMSAEEHDILERFERGELLSTPGAERESETARQAARKGMRYTVYKNRPTRTATIHEGTCSRLRVHGGVSTVTPPTGWYIDGIKTMQAAQATAAREGWEKVRLCGWCSPSE